MNEKYIKKLELNKIIEFIKIDGNNEEKIEKILLKEKVQEYIDENNISKKEVKVEPLSLNDIFIDKVGGHND